MNRIISFPHLGNYYIAFEYFLSNATKWKVIVPPDTTKKTIELGAKYSPDFVCVPFKYNLGNYIEALEKGANVLIQGGGCCRYGYFGELEEKILRDLGYDFEFYNMIEDNHISLRKGYKFCKMMNNKINPFKCFYYLFNYLLFVISNFVTFYFFPYFYHSTFFIHFPSFINSLFLIWYLLKNWIHLSCLYFFPIFYFLTHFIFIIRKKLLSNSFIFDFLSIFQLTLYIKFHLS